MSEMASEGGGGSFLNRKILGLPVIVWALLVVVVAYLYFRSRGGSSISGSGGSNPVSSANNGTATTGNTTFPSSPVNLTINSQYSQTGKATSNAGNPPPRHTTHNPQPTPKVKKTVKKHVISHKPPVHPVHK